MKINISITPNNVSRFILTTALVLCIFLFPNRGWGQSVENLGGGKYVVKYETSGSYTWYPPVNGTRVTEVRAWGGGGGGGNAPYQAGYSKVGAGGGGGAYAYDGTERNGLATSFSFQIRVGSGGGGSADGQSSYVKIG